jgi:hypothetical protein
VSRTRWGLEWVRKAVSNPFVVLDLVMSTCPANVREGLTTVTVKHATDGCVCGGWLGVGKVTSTGRPEVEHLGLDLNTGVPRGFRFIIPERSRTP